MANTNQTTQSVAGTVPTDLAAMLRQYQYYSHGRSMRRFCEEENLDYSRFCRYARNHPVSQEAATSDIVPDTFVELKVMGEEATAAPKPSSAISIREIRIRFSNGMLLHGRADNLDETLSLVRKLLS